MHPRLFPSCVLAVLVASCPVLAPRVLAQQPASSDVESYYLSGYLLVQQAETLEAKGQLTPAFVKLREAQRIFDSVARSHPNWQANMVNYRRGIVQKKIQEISDKERARTAANPGSGDSGVPLLPPADGSVPPAAPSSVRPAPAVPSSATLEGYGGSAQRLQDLTARNAQLEQQAKDKEMEVYRAKQELLAAKRESNEQLKAQIDLKNKLEAMGGVNSGEFQKLKKQLADATAALERANALRDEAEKKRDAMDAELAQANQTISQLTKEKTQLLAERTQMQALIDGKIGSDTLAEQNQALQRQLEEARSRIDELSKDKDAAAKEVASLRDQMSKMREDLERSKKENEDYRKQIAGLRSELEITREKLLAAPSRAVGDSELRSENAELRKMVLDQLKNQAFREEKKRLALEQLAKLQINNEELLDTIEKLASPPPTLSAEEKERIQDPVITDFVKNQGMSGTIVARVNGDADGAPVEPSDDAAGANRPRGRQDLNEDLQTVANVGVDAIRADRPAAAERAFQTILKEDPRNVFALSNIAVAQVGQKKLEEAARNLKKLLAYSDNDYFALYLLGVVNYKKGNYDEARLNLSNSLLVKPDNPRAHFQLGCTHNRLGDLARAREEFVSAVTLDPDFADAHYNLAVIDCKSGDVDSAREHYGRAVKNGAERDTDLEKVIGRAAPEL